MAVVEKNDWISISPSKGEDCTIKWQQNFSERSKSFKAIPFLVKDKQANGTLFVESAFADNLFKMCEPDSSDNPLASSGNYKVQVTDDFQYGQDSPDDTTIRFLVYHDKSDNMYQHRFMTTTAFGSITKKVVETIDETPIINKISNIIDTIADQGKAYIGDPLRNF